MKKIKKLNYKKIFARFALLILFSGIFLVGPLNTAWAACNPTSVSLDTEQNRTKVASTEEFVVRVKVNVGASQSADCFKGLSIHMEFAGAMSGASGALIANMVPLDGSSSAPADGAYKSDFVGSLDSLEKTMTGGNSESSSLSDGSIVIMVYSLYGPNGYVTDQGQGRATVTIENNKTHPFTNMSPPPPPAPGDITTKAGGTGNVYKGDDLTKNGLLSISGLSTEYYVAKKSDGSIETLDVRYNMDYPSGTQQKVIAGDKVQPYGGSSTGVVAGFYAGVTFNGSSNLDCKGSSSQCNSRNFFAYGYDESISRVPPSLPAKLDSHFGTDLTTKYYNEVLAGRDEKSIPDGEQIGSKGFWLVPLLSLNGSEDLSDPNYASFQIRFFTSEASRLAYFQKNGITPDPTDPQVGGTKTGSGGSGFNGDQSKSPGGIFSPLWSIVSGIIQVLIIAINGLLYLIFAFIILPMIQAVLSIRVYTDGFVNVIYPGWLILRNLADYLLILGMLAIGLGTLFRLEKYNYKHLLVNLIIAAVLVNFSLVLGQAVLGVADTLQNQFLPAENCGISDAIAGTGNVCTNTVIGQLSKKLMIDPALNLFHLNGLTTSTVGDLFVPFITFWLALMSFFMFFAVAAFLVIRLVFLWILLMVSPVAFAARVIPATEQYFTKWWKEFIKYAFTVPIFAFFLNMAALLAVQLQNSGFTSMFHVASNDQGVATLVLTVTSNLLIMAFLLFGLLFAQSSGTYAASGITNFAKKAGSAPIVLGGIGLKKLPGYATEVIHGRTGVQLNPKEWIKGWQESRKITQRRRRLSGLAKAESRGSTMANPTAWFQRNWSTTAIKRGLAGGEKQGRKLLSDAKEEKAKAEQGEKAVAELRKKAQRMEDIIANKFASAARRARATTLLAEYNAEADRLEKEAEERHLNAIKLEDKGKSLIKPTDYETQHEVRALTAEEKKDIHAESWEELLDLFKGGFRDQNVGRMQAIMQKLAETYNENEALSHLRYLEDVKDKNGKVLHAKGDFFDQSTEGMKDFYRQYFGGKAGDGLGLGNRAADRMATDIMDIAEHKNHLGIMRGTKVEDGEVKWKSEDELDHERGVEQGKMNKGKLHGDTNRLARAYEYTSVNGRVRFDIEQSHILDKLVEGGIEYRFRVGRGNVSESNMWADTARYNLMMAISKAKKLKGNIQATNRDGKLLYLDGQGKETIETTSTPKMISRKADAAETILTYLQRGETIWKEGQMEAHERALQERAKKGTLPEFEIKRLREAGYLDDQNNVIGKMGDLREVEKQLRDMIR